MDVVANEVINRRFGPVRLAPGYSAINATTYVFAAFITIGMLAFISFIQPYLLNANLQVPESQQGRALGILGFSNEIVSLLLVAPIGALADKIGRRPVYSLGFLWLAVGFFLYPLARTFPQLIAAALFFSGGVSAVGCMLATVLADTPREESRGLLVGTHRLLPGPRCDARGPGAGPPAAAARRRWHGCDRSRPGHARRSPRRSACSPPQSAGPD